MCRFTTALVQDTEGATLHSCADPHQTGATGAAKTPLVPRPWWSGMCCRVVKSTEHFPISEIFLKLIYLCVLVCECMYTSTCMQKPVEVRRGHQIPPELELYDCEPPCGCLEPNLGHLQEQ